ncbi:MAG: hypothetical protein ACOH1E_05240 [Brevundimonas sp.]
MLRLVSGLIAGVVAAFVVMMALELIGFFMFPPPAGLNPADAEDVRQMMAAAPLAAKVWVVFGWFVAAVAGGWLARRLTRWHRAGWVIVGLIVLGGVFNLIQIPHPLWMQIATFVVPMLAGWIVTQLPAGAPDLVR